MYIYGMKITKKGEKIPHVLYQKKKKKKLPLLYMVEITNNLQFFLLPVYVHDLQHNAQYDYDLWLYTI